VIYIYLSVSRVRSCLYFVKSSTTLIFSSNHISLLSKTLTNLSASQKLSLFTHSIKQIIHYHNIFTTTSFTKFINHFEILKVINTVIINEIKIIFLVKSCQIHLNKSKNKDIIITQQALNITKKILLDQHQ